MKATKILLSLKPAQSLFTLFYLPLCKFKITIH
jgi:hypothetical protein